MISIVATIVFWLNFAKVIYVLGRNLNLATVWKVSANPSKKNPRGAKTREVKSREAGIPCNMILILHQERL